MDPSGLFEPPLRKNGDGDADHERESIRHAWNWFKYHAEQRMIVVRFYLIMAGALGAGYISALNSGKNFLAVIVAVFGAGTSFLFARLDRRVAYLIKLGEAALAHEEQVLATETGNQAIQIIGQAGTSPQGWFTSYGKIFRAMFWSAFCVFAVAGLYALANSISLLRLVASIRACFAS